MSEEFPKIVEKLKKYKSKYGDLKIPRNYEIDNFKIGNWLQYIRMSVMKGSSKLSTEQINQLKLLGVDFAKRTKANNQATDEDYLLAFKKYFEREGNIDVPKKHREDGLDLCYKKTAYKRQYKKNNVNKEVIDFFESIPGWTWEFVNRGIIEFEYGVSILREYHKQHGHLRIPRKELINGNNISYWTGDLRKSYRKGELDNYKIKELESIPSWHWNPKSYSEARNDSSQTTQQNMQDDKTQTFIQITWERIKKIVVNTIEFFTNAISSKDFSSEDKISQQKYRGSDHAKWATKIKEIYNYTCCISGIKTHSLLESSHIVGWGKDKKIRLDYRNGICLSKLLHSCFDNGIITIDENYIVNISEKIRSDKILFDYLEVFEGKKINLPQNEEYFPLKSYLKRHSESF